jgi:uncharacterized repeat protein (TIGR03803 family)
VLLPGLLTVLMRSTAATAQTPLTPLHVFTFSPNALIQYPDGNFYGTSGSGAGSIFFRMTPDGTFTPLHTFTAAERGGALRLGADGNFYGTTPAIFDTFSRRTTSHAFRVTPSGSVTIFNNFTFDGRAQFGLQGTDGYLYGSGEDQFCGVNQCSWRDYVFRMTFAGSRTDLVTFNFGSTQQPASIDAEARDGNFYGTVFWANVPFFSPNNRIFRMTPAGVATTVYLFTGGDDGEYGFVRFQGADGNLYGLTVKGFSPPRTDAIFRLTPSGSLSILHAFAGGAIDGMWPVTLIEATDGNFYGITARGGPADLGVVFKLTPGGAFTVLHTFDASEGSPQSFLQGLDGRFYGTTATLAWSMEGPPTSGSVPDAPTGLTATAPSAGLRRVSLTWAPAAGATSYLVKRGTARGAETAIATGVTFTHWTDPLNASATRYYYVVSAVNAAGASANSNEVSVVAPARAGDFNGDGAPDLIVYRPSEGAFYNRETASTGLITPLGQSGDVPLPGDYDGDGVNDFAVFRPSSGSWIIRGSRTGTQQTVTFGIATDVPVPGDYDGDGAIDVAVYRASSGIWFIHQSSTNTTITRALGVGADVPVPSDYDGDHIIDVAVFRPMTGRWYIRKSSTGATTSVSFEWGLAGDVPVPGDYDGDGLSDVAVFRPSNGQWHIRQSSTSTLVLREFGLATDITIPADYNADGRMDIAVYRPSTGVWFVADLVTGAALPGFPAQWGLAGDLPAVNVPIRNAMSVIGSTPIVSSVANLIRGGDFDGDGQTDLTVFRPSTGGWFTRLSQTGYTAFTTTVFGASSDRPMPGDYDGDGKSDLAAYVPSTGQWFIAFSGGGAIEHQWGLDGDVPVPADFDGDGRTDIAVFRPGNGTWYISQSSSNYASSAATQWGLNGDVPVPADYDGDGRTDLAVYRPDSGTWYILTASSGFTMFSQIEWGLPGDIAVPGEYDGDARTDLVVYRPSNGTWYILKSSTGFAASVTYQWGLNGDIPVPGDYDRDGRTDAAVWRPSSGEWYLLTSSSGFTSFSIYQWGLPGDIPIRRP